jgi:hypothetical protein
MKRYIVSEGKHKNPVFFEERDSLDAALIEFFSELRKDFDRFGYDSKMKLNLEVRDSRGGWKVLLLQTDCGEISFCEVPMQSQIIHALMVGIETVSEFYGIAKIKK